MYDLPRYGLRLTTAWRVFITALAVGLLTQSVSAQAKFHRIFDSRTPAGQMGRAKVAHRPELMGYFQTVAVKVPEGATISAAEGGIFGLHDFEQTLVGLQVGEVYRFEVASIPNTSSRIYPTIELIDRMHAPPGKESRFPIPVEIAPEDIALVLSGKYVTRVIYVEDPRHAVPVREVPKQRYFEVMAHEDPLHVAEELGRPVAILRMGTLTPGASGPSSSFLFGSPPLQRFAVPAARPYVPRELGPGDIPIEVERQAPTSEAPDVPKPSDDADANVAPDTSLETDEFPDEASSPNDNIFNEPILDAPADTPDADEVNPFDDI